MSGDATDDTAIRRAATALEDLARGETDVDLPEPADEDAARLYDAVRTVAGRVADDDRSADRERTLFENAAAPVCRVGVDDGGVRVLEYNDEFAVTFGPPADAVLEDVLLTGVEAVVEHVERGEHVEREVRVAAANGVADATLEYAPVADDEGYVVFAEMVGPRESERSDRRQRVYEVTADPALSSQEKIDRLLALGCEWFDTENGYLSRIDPDDDRYVVERSAGDDFVTEGEAVSLSRTFCRRAIDGDDVLGIYDAATEAPDDAGYADSGIACYIGGRVVVDGDVYGTFCFFDDEPAAAPFTTVERTLVDLMARWVSFELERRDREQDRRLRDRAMAAAPVAITIADATSPENPIVYANDRFEAMTGYDADDVRGRSHSFLYDDELGENAERVFAARSAAASATEDVRNYRADGTGFWARVSLAPVTDEDGVVTHVVTFRENVTDRVRDRRRLEAVVENTDSPMFIKDRDGVYVWANEATASVFGVDRDEVVGATDADLFDEESLGAIRAVDERVVDDGEAVTQETETSVDGERRVWLENKYPYRNERGEVVGMMGVSHDVTDRVTSEERLAAERDRFQALVRNLPGIVYRCVNEREWPMTFVSEGCRSLTGHDRDAVEAGDVSWGGDVVHPADRDRLWETVQDALAADEPFQSTYRIETADGETRWVWEQGRGVGDRDGVAVLEGYVFDVTDRERQERALQTLHDATRTLLTVEEEATAANLVTTTTGDVLGDAAVAFYRFDAGADELQAAAYTDGFAAGDPPALPVGGDSTPWTCFLEGDPVAFDDPDAVAAGWTPANDGEGGVLVPVGEHGLLVVVSPTAPLDDVRRRLVETAAATAEAAFDRLESEAALRAREAELSARNDRLERQVQVTDIMRTINQSLVSVDSRAAVEAAVCEELAAADGIAFAWVGEWEADEGRLDPQTWAGDVGGYLDAVSLRADRDEPAAVAARSGEPAVVNDVAVGVTAEPWREQAATAGVGSALAVPLAVDGHTHGVLAVYAHDPDAFGDLERNVFRELGETIAAAIEGVAVRRALHADTFVELRLGVAAPDSVLARLQAATGGVVEYEGAVGDATDGSKLFVSVSGADAADVEDALENLVAVDDYRHVASSSGGHAFEVTVSEPTLAGELARAGGSPRSLVADGDELDVVVDVPASADVREFVDRLREDYQGVDLAGRRNVERATRTREDVVNELFGELTERQLEVLRTAFLAGFFEWPRETTGEGVAELLDVSQPTVNRHLRVAQQRLFAALFAVDPPTAVSE